MPNSSNMHQFPATVSLSSKPTGTGMEYGGGAGGLDQPLHNLSGVLSRMDHVQRFLSDSIHKDRVIGENQMRLVSSEISSAIHQVIVNGAAILSLAANTSDFTAQSDQTGFGVNPSINPVVPGNEKSSSESDLKLLVSGDEKLGFVGNDLKVESVVEEIGGDWDIVELDAVELLAEHLHFCEICGKGFKRDANLRMHMRAHGNQFKTPEALAKPEKPSPEGTRKITRFSCPFLGCNRNKLHKKFRPLKSVICVKNHFKRSHCPKMFSCNRCNKKSFSVVADLKSHMKHCGEAKWKCSCGTSFSRKDKLFGHMALFEGHMPAVMQEEDVKEKDEAVVVVNDKEEDEEKVVKEMDNGLFEGMLDELGSMDDFCFQDVFDSPAGGLSGGMDLDWLL